MRGEDLRAAGKINVSWPATTTGYVLETSATLGACANWTQVTVDNSHRLSVNVTGAAAFNPEEAKLMTHAGADIVVAHMGLTTSGTIGAFTSKSLDDCVKQVQTIVDTCKSLRSEILVLCHGGPIATPKEAQYLLDYCRGLDSFYGASSLERLPTEHAIVAETKLFTALRLGKENAQ